MIFLIVLTNFYETEYNVKITFFISLSLSHTHYNMGPPSSYSVMKVQCLHKYGFCASLKMAVYSQAATQPCLCHQKPLLYLRLLTDVVSYQDLRVRSDSLNLAHITFSLAVGSRFCAPYTRVYVIVHCPWIKVDPE